MLLTNEHSAATCLSSMYRIKPGTLEQVITACSLSPGVRWPFAPESVRFISERLAVVNEVVFTKPRSSKLFKYLIENPEDVLLIFDAFKPGKEGLFFVRLASHQQEPEKWLSRMTQRSIIVNEVGPDMIIAAPAKTFAL